MSRKNIGLLRQGGYKYIIGARIRNTAGQVRDWILSRQMDDGETPARHACRMATGSFSATP